MSISFIAMLAGEVFPVTDIMINGEQDSRINIVFLGDGYTQDQMDEYISDVEDVTSSLFTVVPYSNYINHFNVYAVQVPSNESGTDHPGTASDCGSEDVFYSDTYFNSTFDAFNVHRALIIEDQGAAYEVLSDNLPQWDMAFIVVNTTMYGGTGGAWAVFSMSVESTEIAVHELGHTFAGLADEYWYSGWEAPNMTQEWSPSLIKWNPWLYDNDIGIYQYEDSGYNWYRPHQNCKMRYLGPPFCSVCAEQTIISVYSILDLIDTYFPDNLELTIPAWGVEYFSINSIFNIPNTIEVDWFFDETVIIAQDTTSIEFDASLYPIGEHEIKVVVKDLSDLVRNDPYNLLESELIWSITIESSNFGDLNADGVIDVIDVVLIVQLILNGEYNNMADLNDDNVINIQDIILLINIILGN